MSERNYTVGWLGLRHFRKGGFKHHFERPIQSEFPFMYRLGGHRRSLLGPLQRGSHHYLKGRAVIASLWTIMAQLFQHPPVWPPYGYVWVCLFELKLYHGKFQFNPSFWLLEGLVHLCGVLEQGSLDMEG